MAYLSPQSFPQSDQDDLIEMLRQYQAAPTRQQQQQEQGGMDPMQAYDAYQKFSGGGAAVGGEAAGFAPNYGAISPGIAAGADTGAGITTASGVTGGGSAAGGGGFGSGASALAANPYAWLAAAIVGTAVGLDENDVSSYSRQLRGKVGQDILESPNVKNFLPEDASTALKPWLQDAHDPKQWKNIPKDLWKASNVPFKYLKKLF